MNYLFELASRHWEGRRLPLTQRNHTAVGQRDHGNLFEGLEQGVHFILRLQRTKVTHQQPGQLLRSCSERKRQTYDHKTADQSEPAGFCTQSQQKIPVLSRPLLHELSGMAQVTVMISAALRAMNAQRGLAASWRDATAAQDAGKTDSGFCTDPLLQSIWINGPDTRRAGKAAWTPLGPLKTEASVYA